MAVRGFDSPPHLRPHQEPPSPKGAAAAAAGPSCDLHGGQDQEVVALQRRVDRLFEEAAIPDFPFPTEEGIIHILNGRLGTLGDGNCLISTSQV